MTRKKARAMTVVSVLDDRQRFAAFVMLLLTVDKQAAPNKSRSKKYKIKNEDNLACKERGPCFYWRLIYPVLIDCDFSKEITMIDTIAITLTSDSFQITQPDKFTPSARWIENYGCAVYGIRSKQNPTKKELKQGIYKPRLTLSHRFTKNHTPEIILRIELSLPKLLFGNNFDELQYKDFLPAD